MPREKPSHLTTRTQGFSSRNLSASRGFATTWVIGEGMLCFTMKAAAKALLVSIRPASAAGPMTGMPALTSASTVPSVTYRDEPITANSTLSRANWTSSALPLKGWHAAISRIPAFPGQAKIFRTDGEWERE